MAACCRLSGFSKGTLHMSGLIPGIKDAGTTRRCSFSILRTHSFRMATTAFISDVEDSEESVGSHQLKQQVRSYTLLQVLAGVLAVLLLAVTGGFIWMMMSRNCSEVWTVSWNGKDVDFTSPESRDYVILGKVFTKENHNARCNKNTFKLVQTPEKQIHKDICYNPEISRHNITEEFVVLTKLEKGTGLSICLNCDDMEIDEAKSIFKIYLLKRPTDP